MPNRFRLGSRPLELQLLAIFALVSLILGWIGWSSYAHNRQYHETEAHINLINEQLRAMNRFMLAVQDTETGQRGYLLTDDPAYLEPYEDGLRQVDLELDRLRKLLAGEKSHQTTLLAMEELKQVKLDELARTIALNQRNRKDEALALVATDIGRKTMDALRATAGKLLADKRSEVARLKQEVQQQSLASDRSLALLLLAVVAFMLIAYTALYQDLTERRRLKARIEQADQLDALTGLPNYLYFNSALGNVLKHAYRDQTRAALLIIDLDNFRRINDRYGFDKGDRLLVIMADRLRKMARKNDLIARLSGDTFAMIVPHAADIDALQVLADRIVDALTPAMLPEMQNQYVGASIGIALFPDDGMDRRRLQLNAEEAVAKAKREGRHRYRFYDDSVLDVLQPDEQRVHDLHRAVERDEFLLHYQPKIDMPTGSVVGVEALVRWQHPDHGNVPPDEFIPTAEKTRLILQLGTWALREACRQAAQWNRAGYAWHVAVNVSVIELTEADYAAIVRDALESSGLAADMLELEITERIVLDRPAVAALEQIRQLGVRISLDDFGTGYSSLHYLSRFPVDSLKIDKSFISSLPDDPASCALVRAIAGLAGELGIEVVAEGVETADQVAFLRTVRCRIVQGHFFYRGMAPGDLERLFDKKQAP